MANRPPAELVITTRPYPFARMTGHAAWVRKNGPATCTPSSAARVSGVCSPKSALRRKPALFTTASTVPNVLRASSTMALPPAGSATESDEATARPPFASISATTASACSRARSFTTTDAPRGISASDQRVELQLPACAECRRDLDALARRQDLIGARGTQLFDVSHRPVV